MALDNTGELDAADDARSGDGSDGGNDAGQMERNGAGMVQMEWDGADAGADIMGGDDAAGADVKRLTEQIIALNAQHGKRKGVPNRARTITTDALAAAVAEVQSGRQGLRSAGQCVEEAATVPNEHAGLRGVDEVVRNTTCRCACCGYTCAFGLQLGRAQTFELGQTSMWGASNFQEHPVAKMLVLSATLLEEFGWSELVIPFCDRDFLDDALLDSGQRAPAAALQFARRHPAVASLVTGFGSPLEVQQCAKWMAHHVPEEMWHQLAADGLIHPQMAEGTPIQ